MRRENEMGGKAAGGGAVNRRFVRHFLERARAATLDETAATGCSLRGSFPQILGRQWQRGAPEVPGRLLAPLEVRQRILNWQIGDSPNATQQLLVTLAEKLLFNCRFQPRKKI